MRGLFLFVSVLLTLAGVGTSQQFKEWSFQAPPGWQMSQHGDTAVLAPVDAAPGSVYVQFFTGQRMDGNLQSWLEERSQQDTQSLQVMHSTPAATFQRSGAMQKMLVLKSPTNAMTIRMYISMASSPGVGELLFFNADASVAKKYTSAFSNFVNSIHFSSAALGDITTSTPSVPQQQVPPQHPSVSEGNGTVASGHVVNGGTALDGWYAESIIRVYGMTQSTVWKFYRFFPDGWVYRSMPQQGDLNDIACPKSGTGPDACQRYALQGRTIRLQRKS